MNMIFHRPVEREKKPLPEKLALAVKDLETKLAEQKSLFPYEWFEQDTSAKSAGKRTTFCTRTELKTVRRRAGIDFVKDAGLVKEEGVIDLTDSHEGVKSNVDKYAAIFTEDEKGPLRLSAIREIARDIDERYQSLKKKSREARAAEYSDEDYLEV